MPENETATLEQAEALPANAKTKIINGSTYITETQYVGSKSLLDIIKSAIKRDIDSGL